MDELMQRMELFRQCGMVTEEENADLEAIVDLLQNTFHLALTDENAGVMLTHLAAAFRRIREGEAVEPLDPGLLEQIRELPYYEKALEIRDRILSVMHHSLSADEQDFVLVHTCTLLSYFCE